MLRSCLVVCGVVLLCALSLHLRLNMRRGNGVVLVASMLSFQAVLHPSAEQAIALRVEDPADVDTDESGTNPLSLKAQLHRHARGIRSGDPYSDLILRLPPDHSKVQYPS